MNDYSEQLIQAVKQFEGCKLTAYKCPAGVWTIGYGHTAGVFKGQTITQQHAVKYLIEDLDRCARQVSAICDGIALTQGQFDALTDFVFNLGSANLRKSTLLKYLKAGRPTLVIQAEFLKWCYAGGKKLPGLLKRRQWESERFAS